MKKLRGSGLVIGKFYPFHLGHVFLIKTALTKVKNLTVIICNRKGETISGRQRKKWIFKSFPNVKIKIINDIYDQNDSEIWAEKTKEWLKFIPEFVFTSEDYGDLYCQHLGSTHIVVDKKRIKFSISGSKIRKNPKKFLNFLLPTVRAYYENNLYIRS